LVLVFEMTNCIKILKIKNDNEYFREYILYLQTPNYKRLLDFIDSNKFQVYIMGHSCGLSDRTLLEYYFLNMNNCCSIKVFYHQRKKMKGITIKKSFRIFQDISTNDKNNIQNSE
jgi:hypothetical protein